MSLSEAAALALRPWLDRGRVGRVLSNDSPFNYSTTDRAVSGEYDFIGVVEPMEVMVFFSLIAGGEYTPLNLFRYAGNGVRRRVQVPPAISQSTVGRPTSIAITTSRPATAATSATGRPPPAATTANMIMSDASGGLEIYDIAHDAVVSASPLGTLSSGVAILGVGAFNDGDRSDLLLGNTTGSGTALYVADVQRQHRDRC